MVYDGKGSLLTESFEGLRLQAYWDSYGKVWTIAYGHTKGVTQGLTCTREQADAWLAEDIQWASSAVNRLVKVPLTQDEFDALCDFTYNCGSGTFQGSDVLKRLNAGDYHGAAAALEEYDHAGGKVMAGLLRRRKAEEALMEEK